MGNRELTQGIIYVEEVSSTFRLSKVILSTGRVKGIGFEVGWEPAVVGSPLIKFHKKGKEKTHFKNYISHPPQSS